MQLWGAWSPGVIWSSVFAADVNGDGRTDLIGRELTSGGWYVGISTGNSFNTVAFGSFSPMTCGRTCRSLTSRRRACRRGRSVVIHGEWFVGVSNGSSFITTRYGKWASTVQWQDTQVGDFNGDGRADIIGARARDDRRILGPPCPQGRPSPINDGRSGRRSAGGLMSGRRCQRRRQVRHHRPRSDHGRMYAGNRECRRECFHTSLFAIWSAGITWDDVRIIDVNRGRRTDVVGRVSSTARGMQASQPAPVSTPVTTAFGRRRPGRTFESAVSQRRRFGSFRVGRLDVGQCLRPPPATTSPQLTPRSSPNGPSTKGSKTQIVLSRVEHDHRSEPDGFPARRIGRSRPLRALAQTQVPRVASSAIEATGAWDPHDTWTSQRLPPAYPIGSAIPRGAQTRPEARRCRSELGRRHPRDRQRDIGTM